MPLIYITAAGAILLGAFFVGIYYFVYKGPQRMVGATKDGAIDAANECYSLAKRIAGDVKAAFGSEPRIRIGNVTILEGCSACSEFVTAHRNFSHMTKWEQTWRGSALKIELKGRFEARAGFTLDESFEISIDKDQGVVKVRHAPAKLISCELKQVEFFDEEGGYWNWVNSADREAAQNALLQQARESVVKSDLLLVANENLTERLSQLTARHSLRLENQVFPKINTGLTNTSGQ